MGGKVPTWKNVGGKQMSLHPGEGITLLVTSFFCKWNKFGYCKTLDYTSHLNPFNSHEWPRQNFSLQYQYNIKQRSNENEKIDILILREFISWSNTRYSQLTSWELYSKQWGELLNKKLWVKGLHIHAAVYAMYIYKKYLQTSFIAHS